MNTVYEKLVQMAKEEAEGRKDMPIKTLCASIAMRFRLNNKEVYSAIQEINNTSKMKFGRIGKITFTFANKE